MKTSAVLIVFSFLLFSSCGNEKKSETEKKDSPSTEQTQEESPALDKGIGEIQQVELNDPLNEEMVQKGKIVYEAKCASCHNLNGDNKLGPSFKGVTTRRSPEWIMNMITNVDVMLDQDPEAKKLLTAYQTRMTQQDVSIAEARDVLEFLYKNDEDLSAN